MEESMSNEGPRKKKRSRYSYIAITAAAVFIAAYALIVHPMFAEAKGRFGRPVTADEMMQTLTERLSLTPEQVEAVRPIIEEKLAKQDEIRGRTDTDRKARRAEMRKLRWNTEIRLGEILTDEQVDRYLDLKQEQRKGFTRGKHHGGWMQRGLHREPEQVIERLRTKLDLSEEQAMQAAPVIKESLEKRRAVYDKYREEGLKERDAMRAEIQAIRDETHAKLAPILDDEQNERFNAMKQQRHEHMHKWIDRHGPKEY